MTRQQLEREVATRLTSDAYIDRIDLDEYNIYTDVWVISMADIKWIGGMVDDILCIGVDGYKITVRVKWHETIV